MCNVERCADDIDDCCLVRSRGNGGYIANSSVGCYPGTCSISSSRDVAKKLVIGSILQLRYRFPSRFKTHIQHLSFSVAMKPIKDDGVTNAHALHIKGCSRSKQYGAISARLKTGCNHSPFQIRGSLHTSQHVLASANATFEKLLKNQLHDLLETSNQGVFVWREKWTRHCLCQFYDLFFLNRCVRVGWKFLSPVEFRLLV